MVLLGTLMAPVTAWAGPLVSYNLLATLAPPCLVWLRISRCADGCGWDRQPSAGCFTGSARWLWEPPRGTIHLEFAVFPPVVLALLDDVFVRQRHPRRSGMLLGLAAALQLLVSTEVLLTTAIAAIIGIAVAAIVDRRSVRAAARQAARGLFYAAAVALPLAAGPLAIQFLGSQRPSGALQSPGIAVSDLLSPLVPTARERFAPAAAQYRSHHFTGLVEAAGSHLGLPLILMLLGILIWRRHDRSMQWAGITCLLVLLLSFGPRLHVQGHVTSVRLPWAVVGRLPLLSSVLPARFALYVALLAALMLAYGVNSLTGRQLPVGLLASAVALAPLVPALPSRLTSITAPPFFSSDAVRSIPPNGLVLAIPVPAPGQPQAMAWQTDAHLRFRLIGCYCIVPGPNRRSSFYPPPGPLVQLIQQVTDGQGNSSASITPDVRSDLSHLAPTAVVLGPTAHHDQLMTLLIRLFGPASRTSGGVTVWLSRSS